MTKFEVMLSETARKQLGEMPPPAQERLNAALALLGEDPYRPRPRADIKKLRGPKRDYYRLRVGNYRAVYVIEENEVRVAKILPRSSAYSWLE